MIPIHCHFSNSVTFLKYDLLFLMINLTTFYPIYVNNNVEYIWWFKNNFLIETHTYALK